MNEIRKSDDIQFEVKGSDLQYVEVLLKPGQTAIAQPGSMMYMEQGIQMSTKFTDGSEKSAGVLGAISSIGKRYLAGEDLAVGFFTNNDSKDHLVAFAGNYLGKIQDVDLRESGGEIFCQRGSFLCSAKGTSLSVGITKKLGAGIFGGDGFVLQKISGDGIAFIHACGGIEEFTLKPGQVIFVDTGSLVGFQKGVDFDVKTVRGVKNILFGGEELFLSQLTGPGKVWVQSLPYSRLVGTITLAVLNVIASKKG
jgi:uncharacterized protein (TIGR00266 family)